MEIKGERKKSLDNKLESPEFQLDALNKFYMSSKHISWFYIQFLCFTNDKADL